MRNNKKINEKQASMKLSTVPEVRVWEADERTHPHTHTHTEHPLTHACNELSLHCIVF